MSSFLGSVLVLMVSCVIVSAINGEGESCTLPVSGKTGVCTHISKCKPVLQAALQGVNPEKICSHIGTVSVVCCAVSTDDGTDLKEGASCRLRDTGEAGNCTQFAQCDAAKESAALGIFPQKCKSSLNRDDLICCGRERRPAEKYCSKIASRIRNCSSLEPPITRTHGRSASGEEPHMARLGSGDVTNITWWCIGVLISDRFVLTTARCLEVEGLEHVKLGGWDSYVLSYANMYQIRLKIPHPDYERGSSSRYNDMGLLKLDQEVEISDTVYPACLHTETSLPNRMILSTWNGVNNYFKWTMEEVSPRECNQHFASNDAFPEGIKNNSQSCTRVKHVDFCLAAAGAPLLTYYANIERCTNIVSGIQIFSDCKLNVEMRVGSNIDWIESVVWPKH